MQLQLNHTPITCTQQIAPYLLIHRLPGTNALAWADHQRFVLQQSVKVTGTGILYILVQLADTDFLEIDLLRDLPFFAMAVSGKCSFSLPGETTVFLDASCFGMGRGSSIKIALQGSKDNLLRLLLLDIPLPVSEPFTHRSTHWLVSGKADAGLQQACLFLIQSSYYPAPLAIHVAWLQQITDTVNMYGYGETGGTLLSLTEIRQLFVVKQYMLAHLRDTLTADWLAQLHAMRKEQLQKGFRYLFGQSPYRFIEHQRMALAKRELGTHKTIKEIARLCGYRNVSNFSIAFKRYTGCTPGGYRGDWVNK